MKNAIIRFLSISDTVLEWLGKILSFGQVLILACMIFEVTARYFFNSPTNWSNMLSLYIFGGTSVLAGGWILKRDKNIRVDIFYCMYSKRVQGIADCITCLFVFFWGYLITYFGWIKFINAVNRHEVSFTSWVVPMWPIRLTIPAAGVILIFAALCKLIRSLHTAITGGDL